MGELPDKARLLREVTRYRDASARLRPATTQTPGPGQTSVWDFPRPPRVEDVSKRLSVVQAGVTVAETARGKRVVETAGAPVYFFPPEDARRDLLRQTATVTVCEWKGAAIYFDLIVEGGESAEAAFSYPDPFDDLPEGYAELAGWIAFYASRTDACFVGEEQARPQPGGYYAGWVTDDLAGPIKGAPGTEGW
ncbi:MAG: DUF427 domain-containing protein [Pseudomonadota bacterium]